MSWRAFLCWFALLGGSRVARAQTGNPVEGALPAIIPTGARAVGMGQAVAATAVGVEALWWNPSLIARGQRELALGVVNGLGASVADANIGFVYPIRHVAAVGISLRYIDEGDQPGIDNDIQTGSMRTSDRILTGTFAAPFGDRLALGLSLKLISVQFDKTGQVPNSPPGKPVSGAIDLGAQYIVTKDSLIVVGASVRNVGIPLQINDVAQADPLPSRADVGVQFKPRLKDYPDVGIRIATDAIARVQGGGGPGYRFGGELSWMNLYHARLGYILNGESGSGRPLASGHRTRDGGSTSRSSPVIWDRARGTSRRSSPSGTSSDAGRLIVAIVSLASGLSGVSAQSIDGVRAGVSVPIVDSSSLGNPVDLTCCSADSDRQDAEIRATGVHPRPGVRAVPAGQRSFRRTTSRSRRWGGGCMRRTSTTAGREKRSSKK